MGLVYVGIDEAGYGPLLGPLTIASATVRVGSWKPGDIAPDVWKLLRSCVARHGETGKDKSRLLVDDSKKLKLAKDGKRHPLTNLERGVLSFLSCSETPIPEADLDLFAALGSKLENLPWYDGEAAAIPVSVPGEDGRSAIRIGANTLRRGLADAEVAVSRIACKSVGETLFNHTVRAEGSKAACTAKGVAYHLQHAWDEWAPLAAERPEEEAVRVVCDRQGGRVDYEEHLAAMVPGCTVKVLEQRPERSRYELTGIGADEQKRTMTVIFMPEAESHHFPVALASMTAKYVRELIMGRFNRFWCGRFAQLKPTAGYREDAARWLTDATRAGIISKEERTAMCRIA